MAKKTHAAGIDRELLSRVGELVIQRDMLLNALQRAAPHVHSLLCPNVKKTVDEWTHSEECRAITDALARATGAANV